jgi:hypothetical protein
MRRWLRLPAPHHKGQLVVSGRAPQPYRATVEDWNAGAFVVASVARDDRQSVMGMLDARPALDQIVRATFTG